MRYGWAKGSDRHKNGKQSKVVKLHTLILRFPCFSLFRIQENVIPGQVASAKKEEDLIHSICVHKDHEAILTGASNEAKKKAAQDRVQEFIEKDKEVKASRAQDKALMKREERKKDLKEHAEHLERVGQGFQEKERKAKVLNGFWDDQVEKDSIFNG